MYSPGERWLSLTKGKYWGKAFHVIMPSWVDHVLVNLYLKQFIHLGDIFIFRFYFPAFHRQCLCTWLSCTQWKPKVFMISHYSDVIMSTCVTIVYSTVYSGADQRKHQSSMSLAFVRKFGVTGGTPSSANVFIILFLLHVKRLVLFFQTFYLYLLYLNL